MNERVNLFDMDHQSMADWFTAMGEKPFRASQVLKWLYQQGTTDLDSMTNLSKGLREKLGQSTCIKLPEIVTEQVSADGTRKWLLRVDEKNCIETVFIPEKERGTLCVSSQVGCALDCSFCSTGKQGYNRNLTTAEIIGQVWIANQSLGFFSSKTRVISNVVMMGMGEPLMNFDAVVSAMNLMMDDMAFGLAHRRVTLSTSGIVPAIYKLGKTTNVSLAISLHAANDQLRDMLVPINKTWPISELIEACKAYTRSVEGEPVTFEYVMLDGVNDSEKDARQLVRVLSGLPAKVNLIPFNPFPGTGYRCSDIDTINRFREILVNAGIITITRKTRGEDIDAACGQLVGQVMARARKHRNQTMINQI